MAVSRSSGGLGLPTGDLVVTVVCWTIGMAATEGVSGGSLGVEDEDKSETVVSGASSLAVCIISASGVVCGGSDATVSRFGPSGVGSGKHSRFDFSQRGQTQFLDLGSKKEGVRQSQKGRPWDIQSS